jgi:hypothetical protein
MRRHLRTGVKPDTFRRLSPAQWEAIGAIADAMAQMQAGPGGLYQFADNPTLADIALANGSDGVAGLIDEAAQAHPELTLGYARTISGIDYKTLVRTANPTVAFRNANEGTETDKGEYENRTFETHIMDPNWECDQAVADRDEDGAEAAIAREASAMLEGAMQTLASQFYYGSANDAKGFPGLQEVYSSVMQVSNGGTTSSTQTSLYAVRFGPKDVGWVWGQGGQLEVSDVELLRVTDSSGNPLWAYCQHLMAYPGLQVASIYSVGRIANIHPTDNSGANVLDDEAIANLLALFPVGKPPHYLFCNRQARKMLRNSRTATNPTGQPAPFPTESFGIPLAVTDAIVSTEAVQS